MDSRSLPSACWPLLADPKSGRLMTVRLPASAAGSSTSPRSFKKYVVSPTWRTADGVHSVTLTETRSGSASLTVAERTQGSACRRRARSVWLRRKMLRSADRLRAPVTCETVRCFVPVTSTCRGRKAGCASRKRSAKISPPNTAICTTAQIHPRPFAIGVAGAGAVRRRRFSIVPTVILCARFSTPERAHIRPLFHTGAGSFGRSRRQEAAVDRGLRALLVVEALDSEVDKPLDQFRIRQSRGLPQLWVHADAGEAGDRVQLVHQEAAAGALHEEIHARHSRRVDRLEGAQRHLPNGLGDVGVDRRRDHQPRSFVQIFRLVVIELVRRDDFADDRGLRLIIAEDADLQLTSIDRPLDQQLAIEAGCEAQAGDELGAVMGLGGAHARPGGGELREAGIAEPLRDRGDERLRVLLVLPP